METSGPLPFILSFINSHTHIKKSSKQLHFFCAAIEILSSATENFALIRHSQQKNKEKKSCAAISPKNILVCPPKKEVLRCSKVHISQVKYSILMMYVREGSFVS
jgi:hypothetical protein